MPATRYKNAKGLWKHVLRISDVLLVLLIVSAGFYLYKNVIIEKNSYLYEIYSKREYENFGLLDRNDELFIAVSKYIDCQNSKKNTAKRVDIMHDRILIIEAAVYLEVEIVERTHNGCVNQVMVRKVP
ncbi:hypothetical protein [Rhizobium sp. 768_B6_N1_8]|uniref:hypothetical protein n=1 Tax=unclassified Rhizobium TaxID=2613769 RepID=UPI003F1E4C98